MILKRQDCQHNQWPLARIIGVDANRNGDVHSVTLCVADSHNGNQTLRRPLIYAMFLRQFTLILYNLLLAICCCVKDKIISTKFVHILMYQNQRCSN